MAPAATTTPISLATATSHWEVVPQGMFSRHFDLKRGGQLVASLRMSFWKEGCEFTIAGHQFAIRRVSLWKDGFQLFAGDMPLCDAKRSFWSRSFDVAMVDERWVLRPAGWFTRNYLFISDQREVGQRQVGIVRPTGWFTRTRAAEFAEEVPPPVQVFAIFLVLVVSQRRQKHSS